MTLALHIFALLIGAYVFYLTFVMRESTEGKWVNRIEEFWVRIDDRGKAVGENTRSLFSALAQKVTKTFNRIVGVRIISIRLVGISGSLSFASALFFYGVFFELLAYAVRAYHLLWKPTPSVPSPQGAVSLFVASGMVLFLMFGVCILLALLPIFLRSSIWAWISCSPTLLAVFGFFRLLYLHRINGANLTLFSVLVASLASDIVLLMIIRLSLKWMLADVTLLRMIGATLIQLLLFVVVFFLPMKIVIFQSLLRPSGNLAVGLFMLVLFNIPTALASVSFLFSLLFVLLHRVTWPLLSQLAYILTRNDVLEKRKAVRTIAGCLIAYGLSGMPGMAFLLRIVQLFNK